MDPDEVIDERYERLMGGWWQAWAQLGKAILAAEQGAAYGPGQQEIRTRQRFGDPTPSRLRLDGPPSSVRVRDPDADRLRRLRENALGRLAYHLAWLEHELAPPEPPR